MVLAVTSENGEIFQHFGKCPGFEIYHIERNKIISKDYVSTNGSGHSLLFEFLKERNVEVLICGGIGQGARDALASGNIKVISGQLGSSEAAVNFYLSGDLKDNPVGGCCSHHHSGGESHTCGSHGCGSH